MYKTIILVCTSIKYVAIRTVRLFIHTRTETLMLNSPKYTTGALSTTNTLNGLLIKTFVFHPLSN